MPRKYKPNLKNKIYRRADPENMSKAIHAIESKSLSIRKAAAKYNINYSAVFRRLKRLPGSIKAHGGQPALNANEESFIVHRIQICADWGYPLDAFTLRMLVKQYLDELGKVIKRFKNNVPGRDWAYSFLHRHKKEISERLCQNIKRSRAAVSPEVITDYFKLLENELKDVPPQNILNYDETNLRDDPGKKKVIVRRGCKYPERVMNSSKSSTSIMFSAAGDGTILPPYVVYKAVHLYGSWTQNGPKYTRYNRTKSGWFDSQCFEDWVRTIAIPYLKKLTGKKVLIGDNLASHVSMELIRLCLEHDIHFIYLPANSTHLTQPLDVAFFAPLKRYWRQILEQWKLKAGRNMSCVPKDKFPRLLNNLMKKIEVNGSNNIKSGFRKCGIIPIDKDEVLKMFPVESNNSDNQPTQEIEALDKAFVNLLKSMRYEETGKPQKKSKLKIAAGKSAAVENFDSDSGSDNEFNETDQEFNETERESDFEENEDIEIKVLPTEGNNKSISASISDESPDQFLQAKAWIG
ncbi:uncharacterized protein LOC119081087 [Bradysia coprophila]|uniref:uncharacterized protein LOC119081087 n=1 Tax=Bradysia coprophila TaxID=38358 RepID=UPI00187DA129|nr:uncharacterized protein LOC119081087 [Bradysia coprophila]